jgi:hypothetical protein
VLAVEPVLKMVRDELNNEREADQHRRLNKKSKFFFRILNYLEFLVFPRSFILSGSFMISYKDSDGDDIDFGAVLISTGNGGIVI